MTVLIYIFALIGFISWLLMIYSTVKFYRAYKKNKLAFTDNTLDCPPSS